MDYQQAINELSSEISALDVWIETEDYTNFKVKYGGGG